MYSVPKNQMREFGHKDKLLKFLIENKGKFFRARDLAYRFGFRTSGTQVEVRKTITEFIEQGHAVISTGQGFSYATSNSQILYYISQLENRVLGINRRIILLKKIAEKE